MVQTDSREGTNSFPSHRYKGALCGVIARSWLEGLAQKSLDIPAFLTAWGVSPALLRSGNLRLPLFLVRRFWEVALEQSGDPAIGLELARQQDPVQLQGLAYLMHLMPSRLSALHQLLHFWPLVAAHTEQHLELNGNCAHLLLRSYGNYQLAKPEVDFWMVRQVLHLRSVPVSLSAVKEVRLRRSEPDNPEPWLRAVRAPVIFCAPHDEMILDIAALRAPSNAGSTVIREAVAKSLEDYALQTDRGSELERASAEVLHHLADNLGLEAVAERLHLTPRTLRRALQRDGWSFSAIVEEHRRLLSVDLLESTELSIGEVADRLGFDEQASFIRAFRRWYGTTPGRYRLGED
ncbi:helix-turn-helix transcriptional regulator [Pseudomonas aeruginosa]|uniref:helix-turn-helix transcriptional regulator n=1 Tax=Pseudomonas aeruginosa TaxID=287 RepID=UPI0032E44C53